MAKRCVSYFNCFQDWFVEIWKSREAEEHAVDELGQLLQGAGGRVGVLLLQRGHQPGDVREQLEEENSLLQKWLQIMCRALTHMLGNKNHPPQTERTVNRSWLQSYSRLHPSPYELSIDYSVDFSSANAIDVRGFHAGWHLQVCAAALLCYNPHALCRSISTKPHIYGGLSFTCWLPSAGIQTYKTDESAYEECCLVCYILYCIN